MLKLVQCIKGQPDIELYEFRQYWSEYCKRFDAFLKRYGTPRIDFSTALAVEDNLSIMVERGTSTPYDGMVEVYFENAGVLRQLLEDPEFQNGLAEIQLLQEEFIDFGNSTFFFAIDDERT